MNRTFFIFTLASFLISITALGQLPRGEDVIEVPAVGEGLCLHNLFQSNMVLQRDKPINIWGWGTPREKVEVTLDGQTQETRTAADRSWSVTFPALSASTTPKKLTVKGSRQTLNLDNILIGDVWLLGGQSNMEYSINQVENGKLEIISANFPQIRILSVPFANEPEHQLGFPRLHQWSSWSKKHSRKGDWDVCNPKTVRDLSAIGYVFARRLHMASGVPIGVIDASRGGTTVETWTPSTSLKQIDSQPLKAKLAEWDKEIATWDAKKDLEKRIAQHKNWLQKMEKAGRTIKPEQRKPPIDLKPGPSMDQNRPGNCYAGMIAPIAGLTVKGAIFHQGYNNCFEGSVGAKMYADIFPVMISAWRQAFNDPQMPFGIISLCTANEPQTRDNVIESMADAGPFIREAQYRTFLDLYKGGDKHIGFVSSFDFRRKWYHPPLKIPIGERIARWALATQYGFSREIDWKPPFIKSMEVKKGEILLTLDERVKAVDDGPIKGFVIAGKDQKFQPADVSYFNKNKDSRGKPQLDKSMLVLRSDLVPEPVHYRYAWARNPDANVQLDGNKDIPLATQRSDSWTMEDPGSFVKAYREQDRLRKLKEAQDFIDQNKP